MKILHVNKFLYRRGGAESYMFDLAAMQREQGHSVEFWGMTHPENDPCTFSAHFVDETDFGEHQASPVEQVKLLARMIYSSSARARLAKVLEQLQPDVIHAHNIYHQISPSILLAASKAGVPVVLTMHDYKLVCPSYQLLANDEVCERCVTGGVHNAIRQRCNRGSLGASVAVAVESGVHRATKAYATVATLIAPSHFMADVVRRSGRFSQPIAHIPHFTELDREQASPHTSSVIVFAGRLSSEKGVDVLIDAARLLEQRDVDVTIAIAGDGPHDAALRAQADGLSNVRFEGRLDKAGVNELLANAAALVAPSTWHENQPMIILEAIAAGLPIVASDIGGIGELVRTNLTGTLVPPGNATLLADAIQDLLGAPEQRQKMGAAGRELAAREFGAATHLEAIDAAYEQAIHATKNTNSGAEA